MSRSGKCLSFILFSLSGCVTNESKFVPVQPSDGKDPVVYIYRPSSFSNVVVSPGVIIDGKERFLISNDRCTFVYVSPGKHVFRLNLDAHYRGNFEQQLEVKPGQRYFLRVETSMKFVQGQSYIRNFNLKEVSVEIGLDEVKKCRYVKPEMPSKYLWKKDESGQGSQFTIEKTSDPFSRNK